MAGTDFVITGGGGQLGRSLLLLCSQRGLAAVGRSHAELPVEDEGAVRRCLAELRPRHVLHCGAWTNVDGCEAEPQRAMACNGTGTANVAAACADVGAGLVYVSTDFVFDGRAKEPYGVDAKPAPLSVYGQSKLAGERAVLAHKRRDFHVLRTSWVFGPGGKNFPKAILDRARSGQPVNVVTDQIGRPTYTEDLAAAMLDLAARARDGGIWHAANEGACSWHQFACDVLAAAGLGQVPVGRITAATLARPAARPAWSVLDSSRLDDLRGRPFPPYQDAIARWLRAETP